MINARKPFLIIALLLAFVVSVLSVIIAKDGVALTSNDVSVNALTTAANGAIDSSFARDKQSSVTSSTMKTTSPAKNETATSSQDNEAIQIHVVTEEWRPFNYTDSENGEVVGFVTERLKAILDSIDAKYTIESKTWDLAYQQTKNVPGTLLYTIEKTKEREAEFQWICPLIDPVPVNLYKLASREDIIVNELDDAKNHIISIEKGESDHQKLNSYGFIDGEHLQVTDNPYGGPTLFFEKKVDLVIQSEPEMQHYLDYFDRPQDDVVELIELRKVKGCLAFGLKTDKNLVEKVRKAVLEYNKKFPFSAP